VLSRFEHIEAIPADPARWESKSIAPGRAASLAAVLAERRADALLFRRLATLRQDVPIQERLSDLRWRGAHGSLKDLCLSLGDERLPARVPLWQ
jgi:hypothetical protein